MKTIEHMETVLFKLPVMFYWIFVPIYFSLYIIFGKKESDPLGKYKHLTEHGMATYD